MSALALVVDDTTQGIGHNNPPTPFEEIRDRIESLVCEAKNWLDGSEVETQEQANEVAKLRGLLSEAVKQADSIREEEVAPLNKQKAQIQAKYNPLIQDTPKSKGKAILAIDACKAAIGAFLKKEDERKRKIAEEARRRAEEQERIARDALRFSAPTDLEERERAEVLLKQAMVAKAEAKRAEDDKAQAKGGSRATSLRTYYVAELSDATAFARYCWQHHREDMDQFLLKLAQRQVDAGLRAIPGVNVIEDKRAV